MFKNLNKLYGLVFIFVLASVVGLGDMYITGLNSITEQKITPASVGSAEIKSEGDLPFVKGTVTPPVDVLKLGTASEEKIAKGKTIYETTCSPCHGMDGKGDGPAGKTLIPPPRNFTDLNEWTNGYKFSQMYKTLQEGIASRGMAQYNNLPVEDRFALIHYIRTFNSNIPAFDNDDLKVIDDSYGLSKGVKTPSQIPVRSAQEKLVNEYNNKKDKIEKIISEIQNDKTSKGAEILRNICLDVNKTVASFMNDNSWNENENKFVDFVTTDTFAKGLKSNVLNLSQDEIKIVYLYLKTL